MYQLHFEFNLMLLMSRPFDKWLNCFFPICNVVNFWYSLVTSFAIINLFIEATFNKQTNAKHETNLLTSM